MTDITPKKINPKKRMSAVEKRRQLFAYGMWTLTDGRTIVFNRRYKPMFERLPGNDGWQEVEGCPRYKDIKEEKRFYRDSYPEGQKKRASIEAMVELGLDIP